MRECRTHNEHLEVLKICRIRQKHLLNREDVIESISQNLVVNDGSRQSINSIQNLIQMKGICTLMNMDYKLLVEVSMFKSWINSKIMLMDWLFWIMHKQTKINKRMLHKMCNRDLMEDSQTIHKLYQM
jgi:hypothetical protein